MEIKFGKNFKCNGAWKRIELSLEDEYELHQELRKTNIGIMTECLHDAKVILGEDGQSQEARIALAVALFNKRAQQSYTAYQALLDTLVQQSKRKAKDQNA